MIDQFFKHYELVFMNDPAREAYAYRHDDDVLDLGIDSMLEWLADHNLSIVREEIKWELSTPNSRPLYHFKITFPDKSKQMLFKLRWSL